ncbi:hypothetical protein SAZ10_05230 [Mesorhizobium sp. BAC0120]|uniref:hypothetical protein n=1 Tax=Mesorhizobium sp. BAC0120 TaxID=3090670 RepID=UPI00298C1B65|nr:hypothetical protein [Mesorhizobium sp. BAC0120]MDW6021164.1 hypothetical protein [Mesorhizobium sp. BAC0120]
MSQDGAPEKKPPSAPGLPVGYRQGVITAITVMLAFSLYFLRFWNFEAPGAWNSLSVVAAGLIVIAILIQLVALWRSLQIADEREPVYRRTLQWFLAGIVAVLLGVMVASLAYA